VRRILSDPASATPVSPHRVQSNRPSVATVRSFHVEPTQAPAIRVRHSDVAPKVQSKSLAVPTIRSFPVGTGPRRSAQYSSPTDDAEPFGQLRFTWNARRRPRPDTGRRPCRRSPFSSRRPLAHQTCTVSPWPFTDSWRRASGWCPVLVAPSATLPPSRLDPSASGIDRVSRGTASRGHAPPDMTFGDPSPRGSADLIARAGPIRPSGTQPRRALPGPSDAVNRDRCRRPTPSPAPPGSGSGDTDRS
jgi:hypothetical protein